MSRILCFLYLKALQRWFRAKALRFRNHCRGWCMQMEGRKAKTRHLNPGIISHHSYDFFFIIKANVNHFIWSALEDRKLVVLCAQQMDYFSIIMLYDRQRHLIRPLYLPKLSDWGAFVGVLLVFILFRAPLTKSEIWDKPNHRNSIYWLKLLQNIIHSQVMWYSAVS